MCATAIVLVVDLCNFMIIDQYPAVLFIGYGDMHQGNKGDIISFEENERKYGRIVAFEADLHPDAIYEWVLWMHSISYTQKTVDGYYKSAANVFKLLTGWLSIDEVVEDKRRKMEQQQKIEELELKVESLEDELSLQDVELDKYKALEMFDSLKNHGDPFPLMAASTAVHEESPASDDDNTIQYEKNIVSSSYDLCCRCM